MLTETFSFGGTRLVEIVGEPGIGKTRLAHEFVQWVMAQGADVLEGKGLQVGRIPYAPVVEALRERLDQENAPDDLVADPWLVELSRILPELRGRYPDLAHPAEDGTAVRLFDAVVMLGQALAARAPLVLFVDDWQWADSATRDVLAYAIQRWHRTDASILILLTSRPDEDSEGWLRRLARAVPFTRVALSAMDVDTTRRLVSEALGERGAAEIGDWLIEQTGGHPLYLEESLRTLVARGVLGRGDIREVNVERWRAERRADVRVEGIERVVSGRLDALPVETLALLQAAAVLESGAAFAVLQRVAGLEEGEALAALDRAQAALLLAPRGDDYVLPHDRVREVIYAEIGEARRRLFHGRALDALQEDGATSAALAFHARHARQRGAAVRWGLAAARQAIRVFAWCDAAHVLRETYDTLEPFSEAALLSPDVSPETLAELFLTWGRAHELLGELAAARAVYDTMASVARDVDAPSMTARALTANATVVVQDSLDLASARQLLRSAVRAGREARDAAALAEAEWSLAQIAFYTWDAPAIWRHAQRARRSLTGAATPHLQARCLSVKGYALSGFGRWTEAETCFSEARERFNALHDPAMEADCLAQIGLVCFHDNRTDAALQVLRDAHHIVTEIDNPWGRVAALALLTHPLLDRHEQSHALEAAQEAVAVSRSHSLNAMLLYALLRLGAVQRECGEVDAALATHSEALVLNDALQPRPMQAMLAAELCADEVLQDRWEGAASWAGIAEQARYYPAWYAALLSPAITVGLLAGGQATRVKAALDRLQGMVSRHPRYSDAYARSRAVFDIWHTASGCQEHVRHLVMSPHRIGGPGL
jgi:tetratricopeptide (TPR) repeat protein